MNPTREAEPRIEVALRAAAQLGEGPCWDGEREALAWVDIDAHEVHLFSPATGRDRRIRLDRAVSSVVPTTEGGHVVGLADGVGILGPRGDLVAFRPIEADLAHNRMNDGKCDRAGRLWTGTMAVDGRPGAGALYRVGPGLNVDRVLGDVGISNGIEWSPQDDRMYYIDSLAGGIDVFDYDGDTGTITNRRPLVRIPRAKGLPDGMTVDAEGYLWVALYGGGAVCRFDPKGVLDRTIDFPATRVTSCAFGGANHDRLYVTSARTGLGPDALAREPLAGALFRLDVGVRGSPPHRFVV